MLYARYLQEKLSNLKLVMLIAHSSNNLALQENVINERMHAKHKCKQCIDA